MAGQGRAILPCGDDLAPCLQARQVVGSVAVAHLVGVSTRFALMLDRQLFGAVLVDKLVQRAAAGCLRDPTRRLDPQPGFVCQTGQVGQGRSRNRCGGFGGAASAEYGQLPQDASLLGREHAPRIVECSGDAAVAGVGTSHTTVLLSKSIPRSSRLAISASDKVHVHASSHSMPSGIPPGHRQIRSMVSALFPGRLWA